MTEVRQDLNNFYKHESHRDKHAEVNNKSKPVTRDRNL